MSNVIAKTIQELLQMQIEAAVPAVEGMIVSVGKHSGTMQGQHGPYSFQDLELEDNGARITAVLSTRLPVDPNMIHQRVRFESVPGARGGLMGVQTKFRQGKYMLYISNKALMSIGGQPAAYTPPPPQTQQQYQQPPQQQQYQQPQSQTSYTPPPAPAPQAAPPPQTAPQSPPPTSHQNTHTGRRYSFPNLSTDDACRDGYTYLARVANFYEMAMEVAHGVRLRWNARHPDFPMPDTQFATMIGGFCQGGDRKDFPISMPTGDITPYLLKIIASDQPKSPPPQQ